MNKQLELNVFDAFWINCQANNVMTVLTTLDESYIMAGAGNHFTYEIDGRSGWFKAPTVRYGAELERALYKVGRKSFRFESGDIVAELVSAVKQDRLISVEIDLFDWNPQSINYHRNHVTHMTMCIGFDEEKRELYFDDAAKGQKKLVKTYDEFRSSVIIHDGVPDAIETTVPRELESFTYDYETVRKQAARLVNNISAIRYQTYFSTYEQPHDINIPINDITKVYNRQLANREMLKRLLKDGYFSDDKFAALNEIAERLIFQWDLIKNRTMKMAMSDKPHDFTVLDRRADAAFAEEQRFWNYIADGIDTDPAPRANSGNCSALTPVSAIAVEGEHLESMQKRYSEISLDRIELSLDEESDYYTNIRLFYGNVRGSLACAEALPYAVTSLSEAFTEENYVKSVSAEGGVVYIRTECPFTDIAGMWHFVLKSTAALTDSKGKKCPDICCAGFGIQEVTTPFINVLECSPPVCCAEIPEADYTGDIPFVKKSFENYECDISSLFNEAEPEKDAVYCRFVFTADGPVDFRLWFGYQQAVKLWFNGEPLGSLSAKDTPPHRDMCCVDITARAGANEVVVLCSTAHGKARGIIAKLAMRGVMDGERSYPQRFPAFMSHGEFKERARK